MDSKKQRLAFAGAVAVGILGGAQHAAAQDFGIGGGVTLGTPIAFAPNPLPGPLVGLEAVYWFDDDIALDFIGNIGVAVPDAADARFDLGLGAGILYALAQGDDTKLELSARAGVIAVINSTFIPGADDEDADLFLDVGLRVEHWFDSHFAMNAQVGVNFRGDPDGNPGFGMFIGARRPASTRCTTSTATPVPATAPWRPSPSRSARSTRRRRPRASQPRRRPPPRSRRTPRAAPPAGDAPAPRKWRNDRRNERVRPPGLGALVAFFARCARCVSYFFTARRAASQRSGPIVLPRSTALQRSRRACSVS
jgi:hypothetical protein